MFSCTCRVLTKLYSTPHWLIWNRSVTRMTHGQLGNKNLIPVREGDLSLMLCGPHGVLSCINILYPGIRRPEREADIHVHLVQKLRIFRALPQLPDVLWWCGAKLSSGKFLLIPHLSPFLLFAAYSHHMYHLSTIILSVTYAHYCYFLYAEYPGLLGCNTVAGSVSAVISQEHIAFMFKPWR